MNLRSFIFVFLILVAFGYFFYEARGVLFAPELVIYEPVNGALLNTTRIQVTGRTDPEMIVKANGREIRADQEGIFQDAITLAPGYNEIGFSVQDRFGNETRKVVKIVIE